MAATRIKSALLLVTAFLTFSSCIEVVERDGRLFLDLFNMVQLHPTARVILGLIISVPMSVFTPTEGIWSYHGRSFSRSTMAWPFQPDDEFPTCSAQGPSIRDYLHLLQIDSESCQERFICDVAAEPTKFMPISDIFLKKLSANKWMNNDQFSHHMVNSTEYNLLMAAQVGAERPQECHIKYWDCPTEATSMINMNLLMGWQFLSNILDLRFLTETDAHLQNN